MKKAVIFLVFISFALNACCAWSAETVVLQDSFQENPGPDIYTVRAGDKLDIQVYKEKDLSGIFTVTPAGSIFYPLVGEMKVDGISLEDLKKTLTVKLDDYLNNPQVQVAFEESPTKSVTILGQVGKPGNFLLTPNLTLVKIISQVGGFKDNADMNNVKMVRIAKSGKKAFKQVNVQNIMKGEADDLALMPGDMIYVDKFVESKDVKKPEVKTISVLGQVARPGNYEYTPNKTLIKLISEIGGLTAVAASNRVRIVRKNPKNSKKKVMIVNVAKIVNGKAPDVVLEPDDLIVVEETLF